MQKRWPHLRLHSQRSQRTLKYLIARGNMLYALGRYQEALEAYLQAESPAGRHRGLLLAISSTLASLGRHQEAVELFEEGMQAPRA